MTSDTIAARRACLTARYPELARALEDGGTPFAAITEDGRPVEIALEDRRLYGGDARDLSERQVASYKEQPLRLHINRPGDAGLLSQVGIRLFKALNAHLEEAGQDSISTYPVKNPTFLVVFGLGLGYHLEPLVRHANARWLILVEPTPAFFEHSLAVVDWPRLVAAFEERGGAVHIVTKPDPEDIGNHVARFMNAQGIGFADGSWIFTHYPFWSFAEARRRLHENIEYAFVNRGFFEDELRMMGNAVANFRGSTFHLLEPARRLERPETAVLVGAGPSLDQSYETLARIRDRVVLFSCGTALRPLLRNGFVPDVHCELENVPEVHDVIAEASRYGDLKRIALLASATVDPRVPDFFRSVTFFFRDLVSSTEILGRNFRIVPATSPTCVNVGLSAAATLGFRHFVLFGTDCGTRPGGKRHADGTIYRDLGVWQEREAGKRSTIEIEGNFGGVIATDWVYNACRFMLAEVIKQRRLAVRNCSDGALIPGAQPCAPEGLEIAAPPVDFAALWRTLEAGLPRFGPDEFLAEGDFAGLGAEADRLFADLDALLEEAAAEPDFATLYVKLRKFQSEERDQYRGCLAIVSGTLTALPRIAMFYGPRVRDDALRRSLYARAVEEMRAIVAEMAERTKALLADLAHERAPEPAAAAL